MGTIVPQIVAQFNPQSQESIGRGRATHCCRQCGRSSCAHRGRWRAREGSAGRAKYTLSGRVHCRGSQSDDPHKADGELYARLGMDLRGGMDPWASTVHWTNWQRLTAEYQPLELQAIADAPHATVFVRAWNKWRLSHNDVYLDAVTLEVEGAAPPPSGDYVTRKELVAALKAVANNLER